MDSQPGNKRPSTPTPLKAISAVCKRPAMYVGSRDFEKVSLILNGCAWGLQAAGVDPAAQLLDEFRVWLATQLHALRRLPRNLGWHWYVQQLYPDNEEAQRQLPILYEEFLIDKRDRDAEPILSEL